MTITREENMTMNNIAKRFKVHLMNTAQGVHVFEVNCTNEHQAKGIAQGVFPKLRVIDIEMVK